MTLWKPCVFHDWRKIEGSDLSQCMGCLIIKKDDVKVEKSESKEKEQ